MFVVCCLTSYAYLPEKDISSSKNESSIGVDKGSVSASLATWVFNIDIRSYTIRTKESGVYMRQGPISCCLIRLFNVIIAHARWSFLMT